MALIHQHRTSTKDHVCGFLRIRHKAYRPPLRGVEVLYRVTNGWLSGVDEPSPGVNISLRGVAARLPEWPSMPFGLVPSSDGDIATNGHQSVVLSTGMLARLRMDS